MRRAGRSKPRATRSSVRTRPQPDRRPTRSSGSSRRRCSASPACSAWNSSIRRSCRDRPLGLRRLRERRRGPAVPEGPGALSDEASLSRLSWLPWLDQPGFRASRATSERLSRDAPRAMTASPATKTIVDRAPLRSGINQRTAARNAAMTSTWRPSHTTGMSYQRGIGARVPTERSYASSVSGRRVRIVALVCDNAHTCLELESTGDVQRW